jgi:hypothetical protein
VTRVPDSGYFHTCGPVIYTDEFCRGCDSHMEKLS